MSGRGGGEKYGPANLDPDGLHEYESARLAFQSLVAEGRGDLVIAPNGAGQWGKNVIRNFRDLGGLSCVCNPDPEARARITADQFGVGVTESLGESLKDLQIQVVAIASPASAHGDIVRSALMAGKHVFVEKPLCLSVSEGRELVDLASTRRRIPSDPYGGAPAQVPSRDLEAEGAGRPPGRRKEEHSQWQA